jgi:hypothetical protein
MAENPSAVMEGQSDDLGGTAPAVRSRLDMGMFAVDDHVVTVKPGWNCKYNAVDCTITEVFSDGHVSLVRVADGSHLNANPVPVGELWHVFNPKAGVY